MLRLQPSLVCSDTQLDLKAAQCCGYRRVGSVLTASVCPSRRLPQALRLAGTVDCWLLTKSPSLAAEFFERRGGLQEEKFHWNVPPSVLQALPYFWALAEDMEQYRRTICSLRSVRGPSAH